MRLQSKVPKKHKKSHVCYVLFVDVVYLLIRVGDSEDLPRQSMKCECVRMCVRLKRAPTNAMLCICQFMPRKKKENRKQKKSQPCSSRPRSQEEEERYEE